LNRYNEQKAINKLKEYNQQEILDLLNILSTEEKEKLYEQIIELDFEKIDKLYNELTKKEKIGISNIEEMIGLNTDKISEEELKKYNELGEEIIKTGRYALVTMSGGQGTRLGYDKPKGEFVVNIEPKPKFLFEILADKLKEINNKYNVTIPWYIMTSSENDEEIRSFFDKHKNFGYISEYIMFFKQENLPLITEDKKLLIGQNKLIKEASDGNGGVFYSMDKKQVLDDMRKRGIQWIFISSIDNILLKIADTTLIGLALEKGVEIATKSLVRNSPEEKVGAICRCNNKIKVIEYSEMSNEMKNARNENGELKFAESHIMCNLFSIKALETLADKKLPYHIAHKKIEYLDSKGTIIKPTEPNVYKFETFVFDSWTYFDDIAILRGKREEDFAPIKNKEGVDSPQSAVELYNNYKKEN